MIRCCGTRLIRLFPVRSAFHGVGCSGMGLFNYLEGFVEIIFCDIDFDIGIVVISLLEFWFLHCDSEVVTALGPFCGKVAVNFSNCMFLLNKKEIVF